MKPVRLTSHAAVAIAERDLERAWIERTLRHPERVETDPARPEVLRAFATLPEREGRTLRVAFVETDDEIRVLTAFLDRGRRL